MDPNNGQSETGTDVMAKLEEDLQKLTNETDTVAATGQPIDTQLDNKVVAPPQEPVEVTSPIVEPTTPSEVTPNPTIPPEPKKGSPMLIISLGLVVVALLVAIAYVVGMKFFSGSPKQIACTAEAKVCDDGTSVGRSGPNCEFEACPIASVTPEATPDPTADWKTYTNSFYNYEIKYPERFYSTNIADGSSGPALPNSLMVALIDKETPPVGSVTIQVFQLKPSYPSSLTKSQGSINNLPYEKYSQEKSDTYLFVSEDKKRYVEILIDRNLDVDYKKGFDQILSTFNFIEATSSGSPTSSPSATPAY